MNLKLFKGKDFSLLMSGKLISLIGTQMQDFALSLYVLKITGSATLFALVIIIGLIPQLILSPIAGVFADWLDRKKIIVYLDILSGIIASAFALVFMANGKLSLFSIYMLVILLTLSSVLYQPAINTIIPTITKKEDLIDANGINSLIMTFGNLIAPLVAGILFGFYGLFVILILNSVSFIIASIAEMFIKIPKNTKMPDKVSFKAFNNDFMEGINFIKDRKLLLNIIILAPILNFVLSPLSSTGIIYITKKIMKISDLQYGVMQMILVASMIVSPFIASKFAKKYTLGKILFFDVLLSSLLIAVMAITPTPYYLNLFNSNLIPFISITIIFFLVAAILTSANIALSSMFQQIVPIPMMGRVSSVMGTCCMACMPLGQVVFGVMFDNLSAWLCLLIAGLILLIAILAFRKALWNTDEVADADSDKEVLAENKIDLVEN